MSTAREDLPPHYHALRLLWTALQVVVLLVVVGLLAAAYPPGELVGDVADGARDLQHRLF